MKLWPLYSRHHPEIDLVFAYFINQTLYPSTLVTSSNTSFLNIPNIERRIFVTKKIGFQIVVLALYVRVKSEIYLCNKLGLLSSQRYTLHRPLIAHSISQVNNPFSISLSYLKISLFLWFDLIWLAKIIHRCTHKLFKLRNL